LELIDAPFKIGKVSPKDVIVSVMMNFLPANPNTAEAYKHAVSEYLRFTSARGLPPASGDSLREFLECQIDTGRSARTANIKMHGIKGSILHAARSLGMSQKDYAALKISLGEVRDVRIVPTMKSARASRMLSKRDESKILEASSRRTALFIEFLFTTGCRVSEMINARADRVSVRDDVAEIPVIGKALKERKVIIPLSLLLDIQAVFNGSVYLFETKGGKRFYRQYISSEIRKAARNTLEKTTSAHDLRHSFATIMIEKTGKLKALADYLGHSSEATTADIYCHDSFTDDELLK
jgi:site-specific recombinase XerD